MRNQRPAQFKVFTDWLAEQGVDYKACAAVDYNHPNLTAEMYVMPRRLKPGTADEDDMYTIQATVTRPMPVVQL